MTQPEALRLADELVKEAQEMAIKLSGENVLLRQELERCKQVCAATAEEWRNESERMTDTHLKQGLTIAELFEQRDALLEALRGLLSYANVLEMRLLDADGEHRAMKQARAAIATVEGEKT